MCSPIDLIAIYLMLGADEVVALATVAPARSFILGSVGCAFRCLPPIPFTFPYAHIYPTALINLPNLYYRIWCQLRRIIDTFLVVFTIVIHLTPFFACGLDSLQWRPGTHTPWRPVAAVWVRKKNDPIVLIYFNNAFHVFVLYRLFVP